MQLPIHSNLEPWQLKAILALPKADQETVQQLLLNLPGGRFPKASVTNMVRVKADLPPQKEREVMVVKKLPDGSTKIMLGDCAGCGANAWKKLVNFGESIVKTAAAIIEIASGDEVGVETVDSRRHTCLYCELVQEPLASIYSCGVPFPEKPLRDPQVDGCGCYLNLKWRAKKERCPLTPPKWVEEGK